MPRIVHLIAAASIAAATASQAFAQAANQNLAPGVGAGNVLKAQLGIQGPATTVCPNTALLMAWVTTDFLGDVTVMFARQGQGAGAPITLKTQPAAGGQYMATYQQQLQIVQPIDTAYRLLVPSKNGPVMSNWVPLKASCATGPGPGNLQEGG